MQKSGMTLTVVEKGERWTLKRNNSTQHLFNQGHDVSQIVSEGGFDSERWSSFDFIDYPHFNSKPQNKGVFLCTGCT